MWRTIRGTSVEFEFLHVNGQVMLVSDESQRHWVDPPDFHRFSAPESGGAGGHQPRDVAARRSRSPDAVAFRGRLDQPGCYQLEERFVIDHGELEAPQEAWIVSVGSFDRIPATTATAAAGAPWGSILNSKAGWPAWSLLWPARINAASSASVWADPRCSTITRWPCLVSTICTAVAPDRVFTFRRYGLTSPILTAR